MLTACDVVIIALSYPLFALVFLGFYSLAGMVLWGIGMGAQESIIKAALAEMVPRDRRATGYGLFNTGFGLCWFLGSALMGWLYDLRLAWLIAFSVIIQLLAIPIFFGVSRDLRRLTGPERHQLNQG
jgi:predicted MFS family arabinose efflux permease